MTTISCVTLAGGGALTHSPFASLISLLSSGVCGSQGVCCGLINIARPSSFISFCSHVFAQITCFERPLALPTRGLRLYVRPSCTPAFNPRSRSFTCLHKPFLSMARRHLSPCASGRFPKPNQASASVSQSRYIERGAPSARKESRFGLLKRPVPLVLRIVGSFE